MHDLILDLQKDYKKANVVVIRSGDTVRVTQRVKEASKERLQAFEGLVIRTDRQQSLTYRITVRKLTFGVGVEKSFLIHSPNVAKVEVLKRAKVRRNYLSYMRGRVGKSARLKSIDFDKTAVNEFAATQTPFEVAKNAPVEVIAEEEEIAEETEEKTPDTPPETDEPTEEAEASSEATETVTVQSEEEDADEEDETSPTEDDENDDEQAESEVRSEEDSAGDEEDQPEVKESEK